MSDTNKKLLVLLGPPLAVVSFLVAFWVASQLLGPGAAASGRDGGANPVAAAKSPDTVANLPAIRSERAQAGDRVQPVPEAASRGRSEKITDDDLAVKPARTVELPPGAYPALFVESASYDFGTIREDQDVKCSFRVENRGTGDLVIDKVKTSCGCTVADYTKDPIPPGDAGAVDVVFKTKRRKGAQKKTILVYSNDPRQPQFQLSLEGKVEPLFWIEPSDRIQLGEVEKGQKIPDQTVKLLWVKDVDLVVQDIVSRNPAIQIERTPFEDGERRGLEVTLKFPDASALASSSQLGRINESIQIQTDNEAFRRQFLFVSGTLKQQVTVQPATLTFGIARPGENAIRKVLVKAAPGFSLERPTLECNLSFVDFEVNEVKAHAEYEIVATLRVDDAPLGKFFRDNLKIRTNSSDVPELSMLVTGRVMGAAPAASIPARGGSQNR